MRRQLGVTLVAVLTAASLACGGKKPVRTSPAPPPAPPPPPPLVDARPLAGVALDWPPELSPVPVAELLEEMAAPTPARPPVDRERVPDVPVPPPPPAIDSPRLTTPETPDAAAATRQVRESLGRARRALDALRYDRLTPDARAQYDTVVQLIQQAEEALRTRDFVFALRVADKAETLARRLSGQAA
jgi:hypothetical protein